VPRGSTARVASGSESGHVLAAQWSVACREVIRGEDGV